jgi:hypothetical protein
MKSDVPFLLVVVDGPSEARDDIPGAESPGVVRTIIQQIFGDEVAKNVAIRYWRHVRLSPQRKARGHVEKARVIALEANESTVYGAVLLLDADHDGDTRLRELKEGTSSSGVDHRTAIGIAREMVESWLLADVSLRKHPLPSDKQSDDLWGAQNDPSSNYPKHVLNRCVLMPREWTHRDAVEAFDPSRARSQSPSLHAFMAEVEALADRHYAR